MENPLKNGINIFESPDLLFRNAARDIVSLIKEFIENKGTCTIVLSGGSTPKLLYQKVGEDYTDKLDWHRVYFFWSDERCVPPDNNDSNYKTAYDYMLSKIEIPEKNIFRIEGELPPRDAALNYEKVLRNFFPGEKIPSFNIMLLGIGNDGHTASLFPGTKAVDIENRLVVENYSEKLSSRRITFTLPVINNAKNIIFLANGAGKSGIIGRIFNNKSENLPVQRVKPSAGKLLWYMDKKAAQEID